METLTKSSRIDRFEALSIPESKRSFRTNLGLDPEIIKKARKRFDGRAFDLPDGIHSFDLNWASERNPQYPCWGVQIESFLPVSMLAADYRTAVEASPPKVQERAWISQGSRMYPNCEECMLKVENHRPVLVILKS